MAAFFGDRLATAQWSNVAVIDLSSGLTVSHLPQGSLVEAIGVSPAGDLMAVGTCDHAIQLWNTKSLTVMRRLALPQECAESVSFSPDGSLLATGAYGCDCAEGIQIWDVHTGKLLRELARGSGIRSVVFSGDGRWLAGIDDEGKVAVFGWPSGQELRTFNGPDRWYSGTAAIAARDGRYVGWLGGSLRVWDVASGREVMLPGARQVDVHTTSSTGPDRKWSEKRVDARVAEFLNDGRLAYVDDNDQFVLVHLPNGPQEVKSLPRQQTKWFGDVGIRTPQAWMRIDRNKPLLAGSLGSQTVVWDPATAHIRELTSPALTSPLSLEWSRQEMIAWAAAPPLEWDDHTGKLASLPTSIESATDIAFRPDGVRLAVTTFTTLYVVDVGSGRVAASRELSPPLNTAVAFTPDGAQLAFATDTGIGLFDGQLHFQRHIASLDANSSVEHIAFSRDARWLAAGLGGLHPTLRVWPLTGPGNAVTLDTSDVTYGPQPPAFSSDSKWLASFKLGKSFTIWSTESWNVASSCKLSRTGRSLAFAPGGHRLAVASDGEAAIWNPMHCEKLLTLSTLGPVETNQIAWSPDGHRVVTTADDGVLRFWNSSSGELIASLYVVDKGKDWLLVTPDGRLDGSENALASLVAWRDGGRVRLDRALTQKHHVLDLWRVISRPE